MCLEWDFVTPKRQLRNTIKTKKILFSERWIYYYIINSFRNKILDWYGFKYSLKKIDMGSN